MTINLYSYTGGSNVINKTPTFIVGYPIRLKRKTDQLEPELVLQCDIDLIDQGVNYCYITEFKRWYFINEIIPYPQGLFRIKCRVDVLESYRQDILASQFMQVNTGTHIDIQIRKSNVELDQGVSYVLTTLGVE